MGKESAGVESVARKMGTLLPPDFHAFAEAVSGGSEPRLDVRWTDPCALLNASESAGSAFVPFLRLSDGGVVAFWDDEGAQRIALCDSEGQQIVLAASFRDFLGKLGDARTRWLDRLDLSEPLDTRRWKGADVPPDVDDAMQRRLEAWVEHHSLSAKPDTSAEGQALRKELFALAEQMLGDGLDSVYNLDSVHWYVELRLTKREHGWSVEYLDRGQWFPVPDAYGVNSLVPALIRRMKTQQQTQFAVSISKTGHVFGDRGNELILEPDPR